MSTLFLLVHTSTFNISLQALTLIQQIATSFPSNSPVVSAILSRAIRDLTGPASAHHTKPSTFPKLVIQKFERRPGASSSDTIRIAILSRSCKRIWGVRIRRRWAVAACTSPRGRRIRPA
ncbi:hypothetical protein EDB87DRAFT_1351348 [Lactarius vividus]|nr:hypothetical protein EDB87DRAFT_1351348 [Lactarius vividus]